MTEQNDIVPAKPFVMRDLLKQGSAFDLVTHGGIQIAVSLDLLDKMTPRKPSDRNPSQTELLAFANMVIEDRLNPYKKECWLVLMQGRYEPVVSAQARLRKAQIQEDYNGYTWGYITSDGTRHGSGKDSKAKPEEVIGIWGEVKRKGTSEPYYHETFKSEYARGGDSEYNNWSKRPMTMLMKVNRDQTHKFAYADKMGNLCTENELGIPEPSYEARTPSRADRKKIDSNDVSSPVDDQQASGVIPPAGSSDPSTIRIMVSGALNKFAEKLPCTLDNEQTIDQFRNFCAFICGGSRAHFAGPENWTLDNLQKINTALEQDLPQAILDELPRGEE